MTIRAEMRSIELAALVSLACVFAFWVALHRGLQFGLIQRLQEVPDSRSDAIKAAPLDGKDALLTAINRQAHS